MKFEFETFTSHFWRIKTTRSILESNYKYDVSQTGIHVDKL